jgi:hypothetical protein
MICESALRWISLQRPHGMAFEYLTSPVCHPLASTDLSKPVPIAGPSKARTGDGLEGWTAPTGCGRSRAVRRWDRAGARDQQPAAGSPQAAADGANVSSGEPERPGGGGRFLGATLDA